MITYKVENEVLQKISEHINALLKLGVVPGYCMDIINGHATATKKLEIYDTGTFDFQVKIIKKIN